MNQICWLTDIHLNFAEEYVIDRLLDTISQSGYRAILIGGDIGESHSVAGFLRRIANRIETPIYFVLGNHDFYFGSIRKVREEVAAVASEFEHLHYLTSDDEHELSPSVGLIGHDGWADARCGDYMRSQVMMNDYRLIDELKRFSKQQRLAVLQSLADEAAHHVRRVLPLALEKYEHVYLLTHVPPFRESCWYDGQISNDEWAPHFVSLTMGEAIRDVSRELPHRRLTVLCGHTHGAGEFYPNWSQSNQWNQGQQGVRVVTGGAEYGAPAVAREFESEEPGP